MARYFLDSSALVKRYRQESGSAAVDVLFNSAGNRFFVSRLALVEFHSTIARLVREGKLKVSDFSMMIARLEADMIANTFDVAAVRSRRLEEAALILATHGLANNIRTLDAIHLATALSLHCRTRLAAFVAADKKLLNVATNACGLMIVDVS